MEAGPLIGGYAGLQNRAGLHRFARSHSREKMMQLRAPISFDIVNDPQAQMAEQIIAMLFLRGDVSPAAPAYAFCVTPEEVRGLTDSAGNP